MEIRCPECGNVSQSDREILQGEKLRCPYCNRTFMYENEVRFYDVKVLDEIQAKITLGLQDCSRLWEKVLLIMGIRKPLLVLCENCWSFGTVVAAKESDTIDCECRKVFTVAQGKNTYSSVRASMRSFVEKGNNIAALRKKFKVEERVFEGDWEAFTDPKTGMRIDKVKEDIDRLYRKLQLTESKRLVASQNKQTGAIIAFANNWDSALATMGGLISMLAHDSQQTSLGSKSLSLEEEVDRLERTLDYYYNIKEEFSGLDKETARSTRLMARTGHSFAYELPRPYSQEDIRKCESVIVAIDGSIKEQVRKAGRSILPLAYISALLLFIVSYAVSTLSYSADISDNAVAWCWIVACMWGAVCIGATIMFCGR